MKVVTAAQMRQIDSYTIDEIGISGIVLMETAGSQIVRKIEQHYPKAQRISIFVGKGNNGGDGLVIARQLAHAGREVLIFLVSSPETFAGEARTNLDIAEKIGLQTVEVLTDDALKRIHALIANCDLCVDAIFGTGLHSEVREPIARIIDVINDQSTPILAVDLPSGLNADTGHPLGTCIKADTTITIGLPKRGLLVQPGTELAGNLEIIDIGFPQQAIDEQNINVNWTTEKQATDWIPLRFSASHKGTYGRVLVIAGATGMTGAAALTSEAALRTGAGSVTLAIPKSLNSIMEAKLSEVMTLPMPETDAGSIAESAVPLMLEHVEKTGSVLAIGPGLSQHPETVKCVHQLIRENRRQKLGLRMVIDADGLNALAQEKEIISMLDSETVLTPHLGEMSRLTGTSIQTLALDAISAAEEFAKQHKVTLVSKGAPTILATPKGDVWINSTGNPGMATAGMGDVLTGTIVGLIAQNLPVDRAAILGVYIHGLAGDIAANKTGMHGLIAGDVLLSIPKAMSQMI